MDITTPRSGENRVTDIASDGDVVLIVGVEKVRLRVSSQCLRYASKKIDVMLGPDGCEAQKLSKELPREVTLPYDDTEAMRTVCSVIHHRNDLVPENTTTEEVLHIAIEIDRYKLKVALNFAIREWLKPRDFAGMVGTGRLLAAAFLLNSSEMFGAHTKTLLIDHRGSYLGLMNDELISEVLPPKTCCLLEEQRMKLRLELYGLWINGKINVCACGWGRTWSEDCQMLPTEMLELSISGIIAKMEHAYTGDVRIGSKKCNDDGRDATFYHQPPDDHETPLQKMKRLK